MRIIVVNMRAGKLQMGSLTKKGEQMTTQLLHVHDSILNRQVDAIVNSAHPSLLHGSGISGVIHRAAGIKLEEECRKHGKQSFCSVVITPGFDLPHDHIIHVVTPKIGWATLDRQEAMWSMLENAYSNALIAADDLGIVSVAIPILGVGKNGFELERALKVAHWSVTSGLPNMSSLKLVELVSPHVEVIQKLKSLTKLVS